MKFKVGDKVRLRRPMRPYYSGYSGNPDVTVEVERVGVVASVDVPAVHPTRDGRTRMFNCVDFRIPGVFQGDPRHGHCVWRVAAGNGDLCLVPGGG